MTSRLETAPDRTRIPLRKGWLSLVSLLVTTLTLEAYLWWGKFQYDHHRFLAAAILGVLLIVAINHWLNHDGFRTMGFRFDNWRPALRRYGGATVALVGAIAVAGSWWGDWQPVTAVGVLTYVLWATVQQHLLQNFYRPRLEEVIGQLSIARGSVGPWSVLAAALLFALLHWPNTLLVGLTFLGGLLWCSLFARTPSLLGAAASQAALTVALMLFFKFGSLHSFEVGAPGKRFEYYGQGVRVAAGYDADGRALIATLPGPDRGHSSWVRIFGSEGNLIREWTAFPEYDFSGELAMGDVMPAAGDEVAVVPGPGHSNPPLVRIFDTRGEMLQEIDLSPHLPSFGAWISIACGNLYVGAGPGPGFPQTLLELSAGGEVLRNLTFDDLPLENGLRGTGICPVVSAGEPQVVLWGSDIASNPSTLFLANRAAGWKPIHTLQTTFGAQVTLFQLRGQPLLFAVSPGPLQGYYGVIQFQTLEGETIGHTTFDPDPLRYGNSLTVVDLDSDGDQELVLGEGTGPERGFEVQLRSADGHLIRAWEAYQEIDLR